MLWSAVASLLAWASLGVGAPASVALPPQGITKGKAFDRFITIWLENQDYANVTKDKHIGDLKRHGIFLTRYYAHTHPSQPNYLAAIAGDYFGLDHDDPVRIPDNVATIVDLLEAKNISWAGYFEGIPSPGYMGNWSVSSKDEGWDYVRKHNPFVSFDSITNEGERLLQIDSFAAFQRDFAARRVPQYVFMSPDMNNDGHNTSLEHASEWSHKFLEPLIADHAFDEPTLIALTFDESETYEEPNHIATLLLGSAIPPSLRGTTDDTFYTHYSILATLQANWGLHNLGRYDVGANVFKWVAEKVGYTGNKDPENVKSVNNSASYPGALSEDPSKRIPIPPPNTRLTGAGGMPILPAIVAALTGTPAHLTWQTPYDGSGRLVDGDKNLPVYSSSLQQ